MNRMPAARPLAASSTRPSALYQVPGASILRMGGTLLIGSPESCWREWLRANLRGRDLICLDPAEAAYGPPARLALIRGEKTVAWRFFGGLDATRAPHVLLAGLASLMRRASEDCVVQAFLSPTSPLVRQTLHLVAEVLRPETILLASSSDLDLGGWPVGPEVVATEPAFPQMVQATQRRAQWLQLFQTCEHHEVNLRQIAIEGARLGSGDALSPQAREQLGLADVPHAEICGSTLFAVSATPLDDDRVSRALSASHCQRMHVAAPDAYRDRLCAFANDDGEDFGFGAIREVDFEHGAMRIVSTAIPPAPVRVLRIGLLRVSSDGREGGECRAWEL